MTSPNLPSRPDLSELIPWATEYPKLREEAIESLDQEECELWIGRLGAERVALDAALEDHSRRCRINNRPEDEHWKSKVCFIKKRCGALMALLHTRRGVLRREKESAFQELFVLAAYELLPAEHLDAVLDRVHTLAKENLKQDVTPDGKKGLKLIGLRTGHSDEAWSAMTEEQKTEAKQKAWEARKAVKRPKFN